MQQTLPHPRRVRENGRLVANDETLDLPWSVPRKGLGGPFLHDTQMDAALNHAPCMKTRASDDAGKFDKKSCLASIQAGLY